VRRVVVGLVPVHIKIRKKKQARMLAVNGGTTMDDYNGQPRPEVQLSGNDGNAWAIMANVASALRDAGCPKEHIDAYQSESMSGDYNNLLRVACKYAVVG
jgi:hypothetical protein